MVTSIAFSATQTYGQEALSDLDTFLSENILMKSAAADDAGAAKEVFEEFEFLCLGASDLTSYEYSIDAQGGWIAAAPGDGNVVICTFEAAGLTPSTWQVGYFEDPNWKDVDSFTDCGATACRSRERNNYFYAQKVTSERTLAREFLLDLLMAAEAPGVDPMASQHLHLCGTPLERCPLWRP